MKGTEKQIAYATDIIDSMIAKAETIGTDKTTATAIWALNEVKKADIGAGYVIDKFADIRKDPDAKKLVMRAMKAMKGDVYVKGQEADREAMLAILMQAIEKARQ